VGKNSRGLVGSRGTHEEIVGSSLLESSTASASSFGNRKHLGLAESNRIAGNECAGCRIYLLSFCGISLYSAHVVQRASSTQTGDWCSCVCRGNKKAGVLRGTINRMKHINGFSSREVLYLKQGSLSWSSYSRYHGAHSLALVVWIHVIGLSLQGFGSQLT